ncbi:hypothetical protein HaLaN_09347 [Haematococcus lacustris]|uniref:Uncharacterized protein n=1 Tax=Haematococcus lacustris TaxID=44745 RepID=A0A699Z1S7_HAELA|nr:hypothetical protein HaLaN_09347 [Haematococcus lacustris]
MALNREGQLGCMAAMLSCIKCRPWNIVAIAPGSSPSGAVKLGQSKCSCCSCMASGGWESRLASASLETQSPSRVRAVRLGKLSSSCWARPDLHCCTVVKFCQGMGQQVGVILHVLCLRQLQGGSQLLVVINAVLCLWLPQGESQLACPRLQGCNNTGREQLVAALPAQLDAQGWDVQQAGQ